MNMTAKITGNVGPSPVPTFRGLYVNTAYVP